jgi:ribosomal protein L15E
VRRKCLSEKKGASGRTELIRLEERRDISVLVVEKVGRKETGLELNFQVVKENFEEKFYESLQP